MFKRNPKNQEGLVKGLVMAYTVLLLHLLLIAGLGLVVIFLTGMANYMFWIVLAGIGLIALSGYLFFRRLRSEGQSLGETLGASSFNGREVEVSLLGGLATMRLGKPTSKQALDTGDYETPLQLEDPNTTRIREIQALADLLEKDLISREEFDQAKRQLFGP